MRLYPGDDPPRIRRISTVGIVSNLTVSEVTLGCHIGTHVDAPAHFLVDGATVEDLALEHFYGPAEVLSANGMPSASGCHLLLQDTEITIDRVTDLLRYDPLSIGIEAYSLDPDDSTNFPVHHLVARRGLPVFVCLDLAAVEPGSYIFFALPLRIDAVEGMPVRAVLLRSPAPD